MVFVVLGMAALGVAAALVLNAVEDSLVYFHSPTDLATKPIAAEQRIRLGGLVALDSVTRGAGGAVEFRVTDMSHTVAVRYRGILPDLFRAGQGVVTEGRLGADGVFEASEVLAKHDERYMPPEVAEALKRAGRWQDGTEAALPPKVDKPKVPKQ